MSRWRVIQAGIVTPKGNASTLDAPAVLLQHFMPDDEKGTAVMAPFDRSLPMERAAYLSCELIHGAVEEALKARQRPLLAKRRPLDTALPEIYLAAVRPSNRTEEVRVR